MKRRSYWLLTLPLLLTGCAAHVTRNSTPNVGMTVTPNMENNLYVGETVKRHGKNVTLTYKQLNTFHHTTSLQNTSLKLALANHQPVALMFNAVANGTRGGREVIWGEELQKKFGSKITFIMVDPFMDRAMAKAWHIKVSHDMFLINAHGKIVWRFIGGWDMSTVMRALKELAKS